MEFSCWVSPDRFAQVLFQVGQRSWKALCARRRTWGPSFGMLYEPHIDKGKLPAFLYRAYDILYVGRLREEVLKRTNWILAERTQAFAAHGLA